jgi:SAM-dependent methyltransferase
MPILRRLYSAWKRHSLVTLLHLLVKNTFYYLRELLSGQLFRNAEEASEFDADYGTDTDRIREIGSLDIDSNNARYAVRYQPSPTGFAKDIIQSLPIDFTQFVFLDLGAGKGRVLLIAAQLPFAAVIGVEFCRELCTIASENISKMAPDKRLAGRVECQFNDVTLYAFPEVPLVCYFYNPFDQLIMGKIVDKLALSLKNQPREIYIIYIHPEHRNLFDAKVYWSVIDETKFHVTYRVRLDKLLERCDETIV